MLTSKNSPWLLASRLIGSLATFGPDSRMHDLRWQGEAARRKLDRAKLSPRGSSPKGIAVLPLWGMLDKRRSILMDVFGGTSTDEFGQAFDAVMGAAGISAVVIDIDSPGGTAIGVQELADKIRAARSIKPIVAVANAEANSAAYWIASAASAVYAVPSASVGSVGVWSAAAEYSKQLETDGVKVQVWRSKGSPNKAAFLPFQEFKPEAIQHEQGNVDRIYNDFRNSVARNRGVSPSIVQATYGRGRVLGSNAALAAGMVDGIRDSLADVVRSLQRGESLPKTDKELRADFAALRGRLSDKGLVPAHSRLATIAGRVCPWNTCSDSFVSRVPNADSFGFEAVDSAAFDATLSGGDDVTLTRNHEHDVVLARRSDFNLKLSKQHDGLYFEADIPDTPAGQSLLDAIRAGRARGMSFTFGDSQHDFAFDASKRMWLLRRATLIEICVCVDHEPSYRGTWVKVLR